MRYPTIVPTKGIITMLAVAAVLCATAPVASAAVRKSSDFSSGTLAAEDWANLNGTPLTLNTGNEELDFYKSGASGGQQGQWDVGSVSSYMGDGDIWTLSFDFRMDSRTDDDISEIIFAVGQNNCVEEPGEESPDRMVKLMFKDQGPDVWRMYQPRDNEGDDEAVLENLTYDAWYHVDMVFNKSGDTLNNYGGSEDLSDNNADIWVNGELGVWEMDLLNRGMAEGSEVETIALRSDVNQEGWGSFDNFVIRDEAYVESIVLPQVWDGTENDWGDSNWDTAQSPVADRNMIIDDVGDSSEVTVNADFITGGAGPAKSVTVGENNDATLIIADPYTLEVRLATTVGASGILTVNGTLNTDATTVGASGILTVNGTLNTYQLTVANGGTLSSGTTGAINVARVATLGAELIEYEGGDLGFTLTGADLGDKTVARTMGILGDTVIIIGDTVDMPQTDLNVSASALLALELGEGEVSATLGDLAMDAGVALTMAGFAATTNFASISGGTSIDTGGSAIVIAGSISPGNPTIAMPAMAAAAAAGTITWDINGSQACTRGSGTAGDDDVLKSGDTFSVDNGMTTGTAGAGIWAPNAWGPNATADPIVDGVQFTDTSFWGDLNETSSVSTVLGGGTTGDSEYDILIANLDRTNADPATITIPGLTSGKDYVVQVWYADDRQTTRAMTFAGTNPITLLAKDWEFGNGIFTADGTTQDLSITSNGTGKVHISAVQVREYTSAATGYPTPPSIGTLTITGDATIDTGGALLTELTGNTTDVSAKTDLLAVVGDLTMTGAEIQLDWLAVDAVEDGDYPTPGEDAAARAIALTSKFGGAYTIATATGSLTGTPTVNTDGSIGTAYVDTVINTAGALTVTLYDLGDGDTNIDGVVDSLDLADFGQGWGSSSATWANGDFNFDGVVDSLDLSAFGQAWGWSAASAGATGTNPVPEPGTIVMLLIGAAGVLLYRKRR